jgi:fucose permease
MRLFRNGVFAVASTLSLITGAVMFGAIIFLPQYLQTVRGISPTLSGLRLLPLLAGLLITSIGSGRMISKSGKYKAFVVAGTGVTAVGIALLAVIRVHTNSWLFSGMIFVVGIGLGMFMQTLILAVQNGLRREDLGTGTSAVTFFRTLGGAIGSSALGAILIAEERTATAHDIAVHGSTLGPLYAFTHGMDSAYLWSVPVAVVAFALSFLLKEVKLRSGEAPPLLEG